MEVVNAAIDQGFDPNTQSGDVDFYWLSLDGVSQLQLDLQPQGQANFFYAYFDFATQEFVPCSGLSCNVTVQADAVVVGVLAEQPAAYTLKITTGSGGNPGPFVMSQDAALASESLGLDALQQRMYNLR